MSGLDNSILCKAYDAKCEAQRKYFIGGIPSKTDQFGLRRRVAREHGCSEEDVKAALDAREAALLAQAEQPA
jgi:hypothetical protein